MSHQAKSDFSPLNIAVLTVSDTRTPDNDSSGDYLSNSALEANHHVTERKIVKDDIYQLRSIVSQWIASETIQVILVTGGTGFTDRDNTPQALTLLFDRVSEGFGELFRALSYEEIGTSTIQSRAFAGIANNTVIFGLPGSPNACRLGWEKIIKLQIDASHGPCNFVPHLKSTNAELCQSRDNV